VFFETHLRSWLTGSIFALYILALLSGLVLVPLTIPILSEEAFIAYANKIGVHPSESETHRQNALGEFFADMHGWPEMAEKVADAYNTLTPE
jgi:hypothetical protein